MLWACKSKVAGGWLCELAGQGNLDVAAVLPEGLVSEAGDLSRGMRRIVVRGEDGALSAALYLTRSGELPPRDWIAAQLGGCDAAGLELLAGRPSVPLPGRGPIVCVCHGVGASDIRAAACSGAQSVAAIGSATSAGTNCGSCRPAIARLLEQVLTLETEAAE